MMSLIFVHQDLLPILAHALYRHKDIELPRQFRIFRKRHTNRARGMLSIRRKGKINRIREEGIAAILSHQGQAHLPRLHAGMKGGQYQFECGNLAGKIDIHASQQNRLLIDRLHG